MSNASFWIIDDEWKEHGLEETLLREAYPGCELRITDTLREEELLSFGGEVDIVLAQISARIDARVIAGLKRCRGIAVFGSGYDNVDIRAAKAAGIAVTNVNGYCAEDIAEYVTAVLLWDNKRLGSFAQRVKSGDWGAGALDAPIHRIGSRTLMLLGLGHIGSAVARRARLLGMRVLAYSPHMTAQLAAECGAEMVTLEDGLAQADYVSLHMPLNERTAGMVDAPFLRRMKPSALLINTARGALVCEEELICAVRGGVIRGAVTDVCCQEPLPPESALLHTPGITVTPHISYASEEALLELRRRAVENALAMYRGETPPDLIRQ